MGTTVSPRAALRTVTDAVAALRVLGKRGMIDMRRPGETIRTMRDADIYGPFVTVLRHAVRTYGDAPALVDEHGTLSFTELDARSDALACGLAAAGLGPDTVLASLCRDHRGFVLTMLAAGKLGARLVLMNTGFAKPQLADVATREQVGAILFDSEFAAVVSAVPETTARFLTWVDEEHEVDPAIPAIDALVDAHRGEAPAAPERPGGIVILTSGTTGTPKGAPRDKVSPLQSAQFLDRIPMPREDTIVMAAPIFHGTGLSQFGLGWGLGNKVVLRQRRFDAEATVAAVAEHRAATLVLVPTMLQRIIDLGPDVLGRYDTSSLRVIFAAGSALSPDLSKRTEAAFGEVLYNLYASTEVAVAAVATPRDMREAPGTVGRPPVGCRVALYDEQRRRITEPGVVGTIFVSSGLSFSGYTDGRNKEIVDGLLSSGDVGHFDAEGRLFIDGRDDDMIVSGGENVFPLEVENLLVERPDVLEAAVVGVPDRDFGTRLRAFVVPAEGAARDPQEIRAYVKANLARHKVPRDVVFLDELPRNATGKLLRRVLAETEVGEQSTATE
ncbi:fatty-acyl-CoA synthase [Nocardia farcinica]|uniref:Long-chain-fatty-acid--CoA ligase n=1 Tax=Nocardia farcinica TaxID=37329 RepID=A0A0H5P3X3_NOCFR|nr:acyl-CoA synthetase [Nocardia farcinica]AXK85513.1 acyl-CoA synthetase [Nocardia farcinica]MBA4855980.1 acyl-CoA synthetase [Nocardia farcinica]MBC9818601.1 acyl-CoA synthetase [Nocardia farcinica]CRY77191.1 Long-chain-fatty-acid--CoA ligase [Nocardia farcinica]SIS95197.1 fatty-acyl-CoA synthase [Nocardia farcinica]